MRKRLAWWLSWLERRPVTAEVVGSNPIRVVVIISQMITCWKQLTIIYGVLAQLGEHLPYKQRVTGSSPVGPIICRHGSMAEQLICNQQVIGSSPIIGFVPEGTLINLDL